MTEGGEGVRLWGSHVVHALAHHLATVTLLTSPSFGVPSAGRMLVPVSRDAEWIEWSS